MAEGTERQPGLVSPPLLDTPPGTRRPTEGPSLGEDPGPADVPPPAQGPAVLPLGVPGELVLGTCLPPEATPHGVTVRDTTGGREQPAHLPGVHISDPFAPWGDSWRRPAWRWPRPARLPGNAAVTGSVFAVPSGLQGEEGKSPNAISGLLHTTAPHPTRAHSSGSPVDSRGHRCDCPVLGGPACDRLRPLCACRRRPARPVSPPLPQGPGVLPS